jgi:hypothetical protein
LRRVPAYEPGSARRVAEPPSPYGVTVGRINFFSASIAASSC